MTFRPRASLISYSWSRRLPETSRSPVEDRKEDQSQNTRSDEKVSSKRPTLAVHVHVVLIANNIDEIFLDRGKGLAATFGPFDVHRVTDRDDLALHLQQRKTSHVLHDELVEYRDCFSIDLEALATDSVLNPKVIAVDWNQG